MFRYSAITLVALASLLLPAVRAASAQTHDAGMKVYAAQKCSICHSIGGQGNKKLPLDGVGVKLSADQIRQWIVTPVEAAKKANSTVKPPMRAYAALAKPDLDALVAYLKSLDKK